MLKSSESDYLDALDRKILAALQSEGRVTNVELARRVNLSPPAIHARIRRLERQGVIRGYTARLDPEQLGYDMLCFVQISLQVHALDKIDRVRELITKMPEVLECHHVTGEYDYLIKVVVHNRKGLEQFLVNRLALIPGLARIQTSLVLNEVKNSTELPVLESEIND